MNEVAIYSLGTYHLFLFEGNTLIEVHYAVTTAWSRVLNRTYLPDVERPLVSVSNDMNVIVPLTPAELQEVAYKGGWLYLFADDLYAIKVDPLSALEEGFISLFYDL